MGAERPLFIIVEPENANCIFKSLEAGKPVVDTGELDTAMAGLACGEVSLLAWEILSRGVDSAITISDNAALSTMRQLAKGKYGDRPLVAGESGVAGLAGLLEVAADTQARETIELNPSSRVLVFGTEGATDPDIYARIVGKSAHEIEQTAKA